MKKAKKFLSLMIAAVLLVALFGSFSVFAAGGVIEDDDDIDVPFFPTKVLASIRVESAPAKQVYLQGEQLATSGLVVKAYYSDLTSKAIWNYTVSGYDPNVLGKQTVTISFEGKKAYFDVNVLAPGDADGNGTVDGKDATLVLQYAAGWDVDIFTIAANVNNDNAVDGKDATLLLQHAAGWDITLGS